MRTSGGQRECVEVHKICATWIWRFHILYRWIAAKVGDGVARLLMVLTGAGNVREVVLFPRDRSRVSMKVSLLLFCVNDGSNKGRSSTWCGAGHDEMYGGYDYVYSNKDVLRQFNQLTIGLLKSRRK